MELPAAATLDLQGIYKIHVTVGFGKAEWYFFFFPYLFICYTCPEYYLNVRCSKELLRL